MTGHGVLELGVGVGVKAPSPSTSASSKTFAHRADGKPKQSTEAAGGIKSAARAERRSDGCDPSGGAGGSSRGWMTGCSALF